MRKGNWISGALALVLAVSLAGCSLALPERAVSGQDHFVGFYLVREDAGIPPSQRRADAAWVAVDHLFSDGEYILEGEEQEDGELVFPGLEGLDFFFPIHTYSSWDSGTEEDNAVRLSISDLESTGLHQNISDGGTTYICSGTLYVGPAEEKPGPTGLSIFIPYISVWMGRSISLTRRRGVVEPEGLPSAGVTK